MITWNVHAGRIGINNSAINNLIIIKTADEQTETRIVLTKAQTIHLIEKLTNLINQSQKNE